MKKTILSFAIFTIALFSSADFFAQSFSKIDASPMDAAAFPSNWRNADKFVKVVYSRPQLKGRTLDKLVPNGKVWRTGANEAAEITFYKDAIFGGEAVKAGTYTLFTIPENNEWTIIVSNQLNVWGSYFYKQDQDVVRVTASVSSVEEPVEAFSIVFEGEDENATLFMAWGKTLVQLPVSF